MTRDSVNAALANATIFACTFLGGCTSRSIQPTLTPSQPTPPAPSAISVTITPTIAAVGYDGTVSLRAQVNGSNNSGVTWSVEEGPEGGSMNSSGIYSAPSSPGSYHVVATSQADPSKSATATIAVTASAFTSISGLSYPRLQHTATLLPDGNVLIAGGGVGPDIIDGYDVVTQTELFDPGSKTFKVIGEIARDSHTATLLPSGNILLTGGETGWDPHGNAYGNPMPIDSATAELAQGSSGISSPTGSMLTARESHAATLLSDGRVLITGGLAPLPADPWWQALRESEVFDPVTGTFAAVSPMTAARANHTSTLLPNGKVLITGGGYFPSDTAELFDVSTGAFTPTRSMAVARSGHAATLLPSGKVLITGNSLFAELYEPSTGQFSPAGVMNIERMGHTATLLPNGTVLIAGGTVQGQGSTATTEIYDPATRIFQLGPSLQQNRFSHTATLLLNGDVLIVGGASSDGVHINALSSAEIYH